MSRPVGLRPMPSPVVISAVGRSSLGAGLRGIGTTPASGANPFASGDLVAYPFVLEAPTTFYKAYWLNGSSVGNNSEVGIWDDAYNKIVTTGSVANAGAGSNHQAAAFASSATPTLPPGLYYCGMAHNSATINRYFRWTANAALFWQTYGCWRQASVTLGSLAATATPADFTNVGLAQFGLITRSNFDL